MLLPAARREGRELCIGSVHGDEGKSLKICVSGEKAGIWKDFASDQAGDLLDLWAAARGCDMREAMKQARAYLGIADELPHGKPAPRVYTRPERPKDVAKPVGRVREYLCSERLLTLDTLRAYKVAADSRDEWIVFPFIRDGELLNVKRIALARPDGKKQVRQEKDAEPCLFGWQAIPPGAREVVIAEGEIDAMTFWQMGFPALSAWSGAGNHQWVENDREHLERFDTITIAYDRDEAGELGAQAVVDLLGRERCRILRLPYKDANQCLQEGLGQAEFGEIMLTAESFDPAALRKVQIDPAWLVEEPSA
jgi:twinkle protein